MNIARKFRESKRRVSPLQADAPGGGSDSAPGAPATPSTPPPSPAANGRGRKAGADRIADAAAKSGASKPRKPEPNRKDRKPWTRADEDALIAAFLEVGFGDPAGLRKALRGKLADRTDHALRTKLGTLGYRGPTRKSREKATASATPIVAPPQPNDPGGSMWRRKDAEFVRMVIREGRRLGLC